MKNIVRISNLMLVFFALTLLKAKAQIGPIPQGDNPKIEYKLVKNNSGCYEVYFRTSVAFNNQKMQSAQVSIVSDKGTITQAILPDASIVGNGITFVSTNSGNKYEIQTPGAALSSTNDYLVFGINPFTLSLAANTDYLLFTFCLTTQDCPGEMRLLNGVSPFSPYLNSSNGCSSCSYYAGSSDPAQASLDPFSSMSIDNNVQSGSGTWPNTIEGYQGNYGPVSIPCVITVPDLATTISPTPSTGAIGVNQNYTITVTNIGTGSSSGSATSTVAIPNNVQVISAGGNGWACTPATPFNGSGTLSCVNTNLVLNSNGSSTIPFVVNPTAAGSYNFSVNVTGGGESNTANNNSTASLNVGSDCNISAGTLSTN